MSCALKKRPFACMRAAALCSWAADLIQACDQLQTKEGKSDHALSTYEKNFFCTLKYTSYIVIIHDNVL